MALQVAEQAILAAFHRAVADREIVAVETIQAQAAAPDQPPAVALRQGVLKLDIIAVVDEAGTAVYGAAVDQDAALALDEKVGMAVVEVEAVVGELQGNLTVFADQTLPARELEAGAQVLVGAQQVVHAVVAGVVAVVAHIAQLEQQAVTVLHQVVAAKIEAGDALAVVACQLVDCGLRQQRGAGGHGGGRYRTSGGVPPGVGMPVVGEAVGGEAVQGEPVVQGADMVAEAQGGLAGTAVAAQHGERGPLGEGGMAGDDVDHPHEGVGAVGRGVGAT